MADGSAPGGAGETSVGDEGHRCAQTHTANGGGGIQHLPHAGAALGALVADDHHITGLNASGIDDLDSLLLGIEHPGGAGVLHHLGSHGGLLDDTAVLRQVAKENGNTAGRQIGIVDGADDLRVAVDRIRNILAHRLTGAGNEVGADQSGIRQLLNDGIDAAGPLQVLHKGGACGG